MEDKDRTIVTFGGDHEPESDYLSGSAPGVSGSNGFSMDVDIPQDVEYESHPHSSSAGRAGSSTPDDTIVGANTDDYLEDYKSYVDRYNAEHNTAADLESAKVEAERFESAYGSDAKSYRAEPYQASHEQGSHSAYAPSGSAPKTYTKPKREPRYVTKGTLVVCMILTMLVSSLLGAYFGSAFNSRSGNGSAERNDSELSQLSLGDATGSELTISEIVNMNADAVVEILVSGTSQNFFGQVQPTAGAGSGVIVREDGYIVTNYHVISGANKVQVTLHNGETYSAAIVGGDQANDIAIIKIKANNLTTATIGDSSTVKVGDTAVAIGNPLGQLGGTATSGIISALDRTLEIDGRTLNLMQTDAAINGGNSGGGLFNSKGELIGIVDAKSAGVGVEGLAFAIPINSVAGTINDIIENGTISSRPVVGVTIADVSDENAQYYRLETAGVYITQVTGENAQKAGFQQGDRIVSFEGEKIESSQQFVAAVKEHKAGDTVSVVVSRGGQEIEIRTELEEYTSAEG